MMGWDTYGGYGFAGGFFGMFFMILFWGLIFWGLVILVQWLTKQGAGEKKNAGMDILSERYAKGEITEEEYEEKKKHLQA